MFYFSAGSRQQLQNSPPPPPPQPSGPSGRRKGRERSGGGGGHLICPWVSQSAAPFTLEDLFNTGDEDEEWEQEIDRVTLITHPHRFRIVWLRLVCEVGGWVVISWVSSSSSGCHHNRAGALLGEQNVVGAFVELRRYIFWISLEQAEASMC